MSSVFQGPTVNSECSGVLVFLSVSKQYGQRALVLVVADIMRCTLHSAFVLHNQHVGQSAPIVMDVSACRMWTLSIAGW